MNNLLAQKAVPLNGTINGIGPLGNGADPFQTINNILSISIGVLTVVAGIWFMFLLITGAIGMMGSAGDKGAAEDARRKITTGLIGLIIVIAGVFILDLVTGIIGFDVLNPGAVLKNIKPL